MNDLNVDPAVLRLGAREVEAAARALAGFCPGAGLRSGAAAVPGGMLAQALDAVGRDLERLHGTEVSGWQEWAREVASGGDRYRRTEQAAAERQRGLAARLGQRAV